MRVSQSIILDKKKVKRHVFHSCSREELENQANEIFTAQDYKAGLIKENMTILDVGANIGLSVMYFQKWAKKIYALEPEQSCFYCLEQNVKQFKNVEIFNVGLGYFTGQTRMYSENSNLPPQTMIAPKDQTRSNFIELVNIIRLDDFFKQNKIKHVDLMKIDTEGAEYTIFSTEAFGNVATKIDYIIGEAHYTDAIPQIIPEILKDYGFKTKFLPRKNYLYIMETEDKKYIAEIPTMFFAHR